jgi:hypothetical protein
VILESKLAAWLTAGLARYKANPFMLEAAFFDLSQVGVPTFTGPGSFVDSEKVWLPDEYAGGMVRWGTGTFPILSNTHDTLTVTGDPTAVEPQEPYCYQIVPPAVAGLTELLQSEKFSVLTSFAQVPTQLPAVSIRLERDSQAATYLGETLESYAVDGVEFDVRSHALTGSYVLSIWTSNREACLWLYALLMTMALESMGTFATWGLYDVSLAGSDLDPQLQYLAERTYTRHLMFTATRVERAVSLREVEWVSGLCIKVFATYAGLRTTVPAMS